MGRRRRRRAIARASAYSLESLTAPRLPRPIVHVAPSPLTVVEDRRQAHPLAFFAPAKQIDGTQGHQLVPKRPAKRGRSNVVPVRVQFAAPERVVLCVRRKRRKEVLHALKKTGRGGGRQRRRRRTWFSDVSC